MKEYIEREAALEIIKRTSGDYTAAFSEVARHPAGDVVERAKYEMAVAEREANVKALIEAQQQLAEAKAEIETWEHRWEYLFPSETPVFTAIGNCVLYSPSSEDYDKVIDEIGAEAIKEVAEIVLKEIAENVVAATPSEMYTVGRCVGLIGALRDRMVGERE